MAVVIWWQARQIDKLLDRNSAIYEGHIKTLWQTQERLMNAVLGSQPSSETSPTMAELKANVQSTSAGKLPAQTEPPKKAEGA